MTSPMISPETAKALTARACQALDDEDYAGFTRLCSATFRYAIRVYSPELRKDMTWLEHDLAGMTTLFESLQSHLRRPGQLLRHLGASIIHAHTEEHIELATSFVIFETGLDGRSQAWVVGRYHDVITDEGGCLCMTERSVRLHTRDLGIGSHVPL
jgi:methanesulfonate monooxygenase subunit beta